MKNGTETGFIEFRQEMVISFRIEDGRNSKRKPGWAGPTAAVVLLTIQQLFDRLSFQLSLDVLR